MLQLHAPLEQRLRRWSIAGAMLALAGGMSGCSSEESKMLDALREAAEFPSSSTGFAAGREGRLFFEGPLGGMQVKTIPEARGSGLVRSRRSAAVPDELVELGFLGAAVEVRQAGLMGMLREQVHAVTDLGRARMQFTSFGGVERFEGLCLARRVPTEILEYPEVAAGAPTTVKFAYEVEIDRELAEMIGADQDEELEELESTTGQTQASLVKTNKGYSVRGILW